MTQQRIFWSNENGAIKPTSEVGVPFTQDILGNIRGLRVFTSALAVGTKLFQQSVHIKRVLESARGIGIDFDVSEQSLSTQVEQALSTNREQGITDQFLKVMIIISAGVDRRPVHYILVEPDQPYNDRFYKTGAKLFTAPFHRQLPGIKLTNYVVGNLLTEQEKKKREVDFPVFIDAERERSHFLEGDTYSIFFIKGNQIITPPVALGILAGITRLVVINIIQKNTDYDLEERQIFLDELEAIDEVFITSTVRRVMPVSAIDDNVFPVSSQSTTQVIRKLFLKELGEGTTLEATPK